MARYLRRTSVQLTALCSLSLGALIIGVVWPVKSASPSPSTLAQLARTVLTSALALTLLVGPGVAIRAWRPRWLPSMTYLALPGLGTLALIGLGDWSVATRLSVHALSVACLGVVILLVAVSALLRRPTTDSALAKGERRALAVYVVLLAVVVAKAMWSLGPAGELFGGTISRTLEVGDRPDSAISYYVVQLVAHGEDPYTSVDAMSFSPYIFSDRGPLPGLAAAPLTISAGPAIPVGIPNHQLWVPFDPQGFAAYRIAMEAMDLTVLFAVYGIVRTLARRETVAVLAVLLSATTPFIVHEGYYTWPKLLSAALILAAAQLLLSRRQALAGLTVMAGYLTHPGALLAVPSLGVVALIQGWRSGHDRRLWRFIAGGARFATAAVAVLAAWRFISGPHLARQASDFLQYFYESNTVGVTSIGDWIAGRATSVANTFVPLWLFAFHSSNPSINSVYGPTPAIIHFYFQYWTTFPFGVGIVFFPWLVVGLVRFSVRHPGASAVVVILPIALFTAYWGSFTSGMAREGLQAWIVALLIVFALDTWGSPSRWGQALRRVRQIVLLSRCLETLLMLVLPTIVTQGSLIRAGRRGTDLIALAVMAGGIAGLGWLLHRELRLFAAEPAYSGAERPALLDQPA